MAKEEDFNLLTWSMGVPLCDDLWLGMQIRNIALHKVAAHCGSLQSSFAPARKLRETDA